MTNRLYLYVGPKSILQSKTSCERIQVTKHRDIVAWSQEYSHSRITTFIIDEHKNLWIADRHCEHVACARGKAVFAAGEMTFSLDAAQVLFVTNQSTGYCPQPESWQVLSEVLAKTDMHYPEYFNKAFHFRRCTKCKQINIIKDNIYECAICQAQLDTKWNF